MNEGLYEALITELIGGKLQQLDHQSYQVETTTLDKAEAAAFLSQHLAHVIRYALQSIKGEHQLTNQIQLANKIIQLLEEELQNEDFKNDLILIQGHILQAIFSKINTPTINWKERLKEITPYTRLTHSELFTGGNVGLSMESELKKEILSADAIDFLVSFIKFKGVITLERELREFTERGGLLRIITTTYMGASDLNAVELLAKLPNTQVKISYNSDNERVHAKAYLFKRQSGFHTGYVGSSNFSRSALTDGLEWNIKITTREVGHLIDKFQKTFDSYWQNEDFEIFNPEEHHSKLKDALRHSKIGGKTELNQAFFNIKPFPFQEDILEKLQVERKVHHRSKNLVVAATGTGKTIISAFDYKRFKISHPRARLLFVAHRIEILRQSLATFRAILQDNNFGDLWGDGYQPDSMEHVFASVMKINRHLESLNLTPDYYDFIIIDEAHHLTASSYRGILAYFQPKVLLGLTATPERMDGSDIQEDFHNRIAAEIRLPEALNRRLLCPFQYFGVSDSIDLSKVGWARGRYIPSELSSIYTANDRRVGEIIRALQKYTRDVNEVRALGFCITMDHAKYMADKFNLAGLKAGYLTSANTEHRGSVRKQLLDGTINYLFVVDIFNEGVDIPEIDTVLFLRPTESLTIFLQQLGRGLRLADGKDSLTVLDFVGNSRPEYDFENKFRALIGKTSTKVADEIADYFPRLPLGCSIVLEKKARTIILDNIKRATQLNRPQLISKIKQFKHQTTLPLTLKNFSSFYNIPMERIYKKGSWRRLCADAGELEPFTELNEVEITGAINNKWLSTQSLSYFKFLYELAQNGFDLSGIERNAATEALLTMLYYDVWQEPGKFATLEAAIGAIGRNEVMVEEILEFLEWRMDAIQYEEYDLDFPYDQPLKVHARYTRDQVLAAFGLNLFEKKSSNREGVAPVKAWNTELLFINLIKSEKDFSPTTMYDDYAVTERLFHWQSQNATGPDTPVGLSYIHHKAEGKRILLFVREKKKDEWGRTMGYVFIGEGLLRSHQGSKPMSIQWELSHALPPFLWKEAAKLQVG